MKKSLTLLLSLFSLFAIAQTEDPVAIGHKIQLESEILNENREIWVHLPLNVQEGKRYPVVYLLDGTGHFYSVAGMVRQLSTVNGNSVCPEMIVVGIPNTNRMRDLTPSEGPGMNGTGGGEAFMDFIEKELIPHIESKYPTAPYRTFIGHSLGGLMAMNALVYHTELFNAYVAIDPSMWWANKELLKEIKGEFADKKYEGKSLFVGIANTMPADGDIATIRENTLPTTTHIRSILELDDFLKANKDNGLKYGSKYYDHTTHGSVPIIAEYDAINFIFDFHEFRIRQADFADGEALLKRLVTHYEKMSEGFGYKVLPDEARVNRLGYQFMRGNNLEVAGKFFQLNVANYPESANVYDSIGDYYEAAGEKDKAIESYEKSLSINESEGSRQKLEKLKKDQ